MNIRFLKDHLLDFEVATAICGIGVLRFWFDTGWIVAILLGLSAFVLIPLLVHLVFLIRAILIASRHP